MTAFCASLSFFTRHHFVKPSYFEERGSRVVSVCRSFKATAASRSAKVRHCSSGRTLIFWHGLRVGLRLFRAGTAGKVLSAEHDLTKRKLVMKNVGVKEMNVERSRTRVPEVGRAWTLPPHQTDRYH